MNIHEYQAKALLQDYGVSVLAGQVAYTPEEAEKAARELGGPIWAVKAQIHAGGRGKGGGVKLARSVEEVRQLTGEMLGMNLVTHQTGPGGRQVRRVYVESGCEIARELYLGAVIDRAASRLTLMASARSGHDLCNLSSGEKLLDQPVDLHHIRSTSARDRAIAAGSRPGHTFTGRPRRAARTHRALSGYAAGQRHGRVLLSG